MTRNECYDWRHLINTYKNIVNTDMTIVEVGSSSINRTVELAKYSKELIGIEKFSERIPDASLLLKNNIRIINTDWHSLSHAFPSNSIDIIIASHVIEHVEDDVGCLNESFKVLKNGGYLLFNTPNRKRLTRSIIELFTGERKFPYWEHMREYIRADLENLIANSVFSCRKAKITGFGLAIRGIGIRLYVKKTPVVLGRLSNFWEVLIQK